MGTKRRRGLICALAYLCATRAEEADVLCLVRKHVHCKPNCL